MKKRVQGGVFFSFEVRYSHRQNSKTIIIIYGILMKKYMKRIVWSVLAILIIIAIILYFTREKQDLSYMSATVTRGDVQQVVTATGQIGALQLVTVGAQVSGQIQTLYVKLGQEVKKGDLIAQIDSTTQQNTLDTNRSKLESYRAQLKSAQTILMVRESQYEREKRLFTGNATSKENLENAEQAYATALSTVSDLKALIVQTQISVNTAEVNLGYTTIRSPLDGVVVSMPVEEGRTVNANQTTPTIVQIADLSQMEVLMEISEADVVKIASGMKVTYRVLTASAKRFETILQSIDPALTSLTNNTYTRGANTNEAIYYYGRLIIPNEDRQLRIGMTTQNEIVVATAKNVLLLPSLAIHTRNNQPYVSVLGKNQVVLEKRIKTGLSDNVFTQITDGLHEGQKVVYAQMTSQEIAASRDSVRMPRMR